MIPEAAGSNQHVPEHPESTHGSLKSSGPADYGTVPRASANLRGTTRMVPDGSPESGDEGGSIRTSPGINPDSGGTAQWPGLPGSVETPRFRAKGVLSARIPGRLDTDVGVREHSNLERHDRRTKIEKVALEPMDLGPLVADQLGTDHGG